MDVKASLDAYAGKPMQLRFRYRTDGAVSDVEIPAALDGDPGRLRGVYAVPGGPLLVTTSNGDDDRIRRIDPS